VSDVATDVLNRLPDIETKVSDALVAMNTTLESVNGFVGELRGENSGFNRLIAQLHTTAHGLDATIADAQLGATTATVRNAAGSVSRAADGFGDLREDMQTTLANLRDTLDSVRTVADSLQRDPSMLLRGSRPDMPPPRASK